MTESSTTLIDNIFTNAILENCISSIIYADISDYFTVFRQTRPVVNPVKKHVHFINVLLQIRKKSRFLLQLQEVDGNSVNEYDVFFWFILINV